MEIYDLTVKNNKGEDITLGDYKGKVLLIVNTATGSGSCRCGMCAVSSHICRRENTCAA